MSNENHRDDSYQHNQRRDTVRRWHWTWIGHVHWVEKDLTHECMVALRWRPEGRRPEGVESRGRGEAGTKGEIIGTP